MQQTHPIQNMIYVLEVRCSENPFFKTMQYPYSHVQQQLAPCPVEDLDQVPDALFPDVEGVLSSRTCHDVLPVSREAAALPRSPEETHIARF